MWQAIAYCGTAPLPSTILGRFNLDPLLIVGLAALALVHAGWLRRTRQDCLLPLTGWAVVAVALLSPLCALSVALFSARILQHMILLLVAAPLIAGGLPHLKRGRPWLAATVFMMALWLWHMPLPYDATLRSTALYWTMHVSLFGTALWLWRELIGGDPRSMPTTLAAGTATSIQMGLLGAVLTLGDHAWFSVHYLTAQAWGLSPLGDQQLGGVLMWVPGCFLFLWAALRALYLAWVGMERHQPA